MKPAHSSTKRRLAAIRSVFILVSLGALQQAGAQEPAAMGQQNVPAAASQAPGANLQTARMRLFGQNGVQVIFYQNSTCIGGNGPSTTVSGGVGDAFSSFFGTAKNVSIGMKETPNTTNIAKRNGMMSKAYFREYQIPANQPLTLKMAFQNAPSVPYSHVVSSSGGRQEIVSGTTGTLTCSKLGGSFTPEAGKDYEVALDVHGGYCNAVVREIQVDENGAVTMQEVKVEPTTPCS
jgi:hypothetical protein